MGGREDRLFMFIKDKFRRGEQLTEVGLSQYAETDNKSVIVATHKEYNTKINEIVNKIFPNHQP